MSSEKFEKLLEILMEKIRVLEIDLDYEKIMRKEAEEKLKKVEEVEDGNID